MFLIISKPLHVNGKICESLDERFEFTNKHRKIMENKNGSQFEEFRDIDRVDK